MRRVDSHRGEQRRADGDAAERRFAEEVSGLHEKLEECNRSLRMEHIKDVAFRALDETRRKAEEQQRKEAEKLRRLREQAKNAQDPKRRVALRLQQCREFGLSGEDVQVPTRPIVQNSGYGKERVEVVDVLAMQSRCLGFRVGGSTVKALKEEALVAERSKKWAARVFASGVVDHVKANKDVFGTMSRTRSATTLRASQAAAAEERQSRAKAVRQRRAEERLRKQTQYFERSMSSSGPLRTSEFFPESHDTTMQSLSGTATFERALSKESKAPSCAESCSPALRSTGRSPTRSPVRRPPTRWRSSKSEFDDRSSKPPAQARQRGRFLWRVVMGVLTWTSVLRMVREKRRAAHVVLAICSGLARQRCLRSGMKAMIWRVVTLQRQCREFLKRKKSWVEQATKVWVQIEEQYLQACFKKGKSQKRATMAIGGFSGEPPNVWMTSASQPDKIRRSLRPGQEWKAFRIPALYRRRMLGRWYMSQVRRSVLVRSAWSRSLKMARDIHKDIAHFRELCNRGVIASFSKLGSTECIGDSGSEVATDIMDDRRSIPMPEKQKALVDAIAPETPSGRKGWKSLLLEQLAFGEAEALSLLAEAAHQVAADIPFFADHPANQDSAGHRRNAQLFGGRIARQQGQQQASNYSATGRPLDLEDIMDGFTYTVDSDDAGALPDDL